MNSTTRNVVLLGKGTLARRIARWFLDAPDYELALVVPVIPEPAWTESLVALANDCGVPILESGRFRDVGDDLTIDLAVSVFYDRIINAEFIGRCGRIINVHNSPLPRYRGMAPINWALKNEESFHGVTIHEITPGIDDGPVVAQTTYSIYPEFDEVED